MARKFWTLVLSLVLAFLAFSLVQGQSTYGSVAGSVTDSSGAVIVGAQGYRTLEIRVPFGTAEEAMCGAWMRTTWRRLDAMLVLPAAVLVAAQTKEVPPAPLPAQIITAKRVFVSNCGEDSHFKQLGLRRSYNEFYAGMKEWGHYELVSSAANADVVLQISLQNQLDMYGNNLKIVPVLRLAILDPKSHTILWVFTEELEAGRFYVVGGHQDEKFDKAMKRIIADVKGLAEPAPSSK